VLALRELAALVPRFSMVVDDPARLSNADLAAQPLPAFLPGSCCGSCATRDSARLLASFDAWIPFDAQARAHPVGRDRFAAASRRRDGRLHPLAESCAVACSSRGPQIGHVVHSTRPAPAAFRPPHLRKTRGHATSEAFIGA
jgi:hypothetical protein